MTNTNVPIVFPSDTGFRSNAPNAELLKGKGREIMELIRSVSGVNRGDIRISDSGKIDLVNAKDDPQVRKKFLSMFEDPNAEGNSRVHIRPIFEAYRGEPVTEDQIKAYNRMHATKAILDALRRASKIRGKVAPAGVYIPRTNGRLLASVLFNTDKEHGWSYTYDDGKFVREGTQDDAL